MKKISLAIVVCSLMIVSFVANAQTETKGTTQINDNSSVSRELILGVPKISEKTLYLLTSTILQIEGLQYETYCPKHKLVLVYYNPKKFVRPEEVVQAINDMDFSLNIMIKNGGFKEAKEMCSE